MVYDEFNSKQHEILTGVVTRIDPRTNAVSLRIGTGSESTEALLMAGEQVVFEDMALYTMVKPNTFNGMPLPLIAVRRADGTDEVVRMFSYEDFKNRLS